MGKPKGLLRILWERGFIDPNVGARSYYGLGGRNNRYGNTIPDTSLCDLMRNCIDFIGEETLLQTQALKMGDHQNHITVYRTPKCHKGLAGEGIEYFWGCAKNFYRLQPLDEKKGNDNFRQSVNKATATENLTTAHIRMISRQARENIVAYKLLYSEQNAAGVNMDLHTNIPVNTIELMILSCKTHQCALSFDLGFLNLVVKNK